MTAEPAVDARQELVDVGALDDFPENALSPLRIGGRRALVARTDAAIRVLGATCPHMGADLCHGRLRRRLDGPSAGALATTDDYVVSCPWHSWEFAVATGQAIVDPASAVPTYAVEVQDGRVLVNPQPIRPRRSKT
jgi:nitrite reductase (NADH) small subunit